MSQLGSEHVSKLLPREVREALVRAAAANTNIETRARAIDAILAKARAEHPEFFKEERP